MSEVVNKLCKC